MERFGLAPSESTCLSKHGVLLGELVHSVEGDEELAAVVVRTPTSHPYQTTAVELQTRVELILY